MRLKQRLCKLEAKRYVRMKIEVTYVKEGGDLKSLGQKRSGDISAFQVVYVDAQDADCA